jgi:hypothetical protein
MNKIIKYAIICLYVALSIFTFCPAVIKFLSLYKSIGVFLISLFFIAIMLFPIISLIFFKNKNDKNILILMILLIIIWLFFYTFLWPNISKPYCFDIWECVSNGNY